MVGFGAGRPSPVATSEQRGRINVRKALQLAPLGSLFLAFAEFELVGLCAVLLLGRSHAQSELPHFAVVILE